MHILWINQFASFIGGCEVYIYHTVNELRKRGHSSTLLYDSSKLVDERFLESFDQHYDIKEFKKSLEGVDLIYLHQCNDVFVSLAIDSNVPAVRFFHDYELFCLSKHKIIPFTNRPCDRKVGCRCYPFGCFPVRSDNFLGFRLRTLHELRKSQRLNQRLDGFVVASQYVVDEVAENGFERKKICAIPLFVPNIEEEALHEHDPYTVLFAGQLIRGKGVDIAIEALALLQKPYKLLVVGAGRQEPKYRELVKERGLDNRVSFLGFLEEKKLSELYQKAGCLVVTSRYPELFGLVGPEAMRQGTPVIGSRVGGIPEWLDDGVTGLLVEPNNAEELAKCIQKICGDPKLRSQMSKNAREQYKERFTPEKHIELLLAFFKDKAKKGIPRLTVKGSDTVETLLQNLLLEVKNVVRNHIPREKYQALLLIGGYGKGEGGVEFLEGKEVPHNNLDFLMITTCSDPNMSKRLRELLDPISEKYQVGFDISVVSDKKLRNSPTHLVWYEMYYGHTFLLGDPHYVSSLPFSDLNQVLKRDVLQLMVNRGSLLIINRFILDSFPQLSDMHKKVLIKHMMKAIIGIGDAYLFSCGEYHWSYQERLARIEKHSELPERLKEMYCEAANFRFQPNYQKYWDRDFWKWIDEVVELFNPLYLRFEKGRLGRKELSWSDYSALFLKASIREQNTSLSGILRKAKGLAHPPKSLLGNQWSEKFGFCLLTPSERLSVVFPYIAFDVKVEREQISEFLQVEDDSTQELRRAYLLMWSRCGDINFIRSVREWGLQLD